MQVYIFRIDYGKYFKKMKEEILEGRLRQGWGLNGMNIYNDFEEFKKAWEKSWGETDSKIIQSKYNNLNKMKKIEKGDIIIIPKLSVECEEPCKCFTVVECEDKYSFSPLSLEKDEDDFGHIIGVKVLFSCAYDYDFNAMEIYAKFRAYQRAVNAVRNESIFNAVDKLKQVNEEKGGISSDIKSDNYIYALAQGLSEEYSTFKEKILIALRKISPKDFEKLIIEMFKKNGFILKKTNDYDRKGGDVDITLVYDNSTLLGGVIGQTSTVDDFEINIQAKKKEGKDLDDSNAVKQLIKRAESKDANNIDVNIVIDLTDEFQKETEDLAKENKVILINGYQFASLLIQFGMAGDIDE